MTSTKKKLFYLGPAGSNSQAAALKIICLYGKDNLEAIPAPTFIDIVGRSIEDYGIIPIENSLGGSVFENYDLLDKGNFKILAETHIPIVHHVWVNQKFEGKLTKVISHQQAILQCSSFIQENQLQAIICPSTAYATEVVASGKFKEEAFDVTSCGAIANVIAGERNRLNLAYDNIQDYQHNQTRFFLIGKDQPLKIQNKYKSCLIIRLPHKKGSLFRVLELLVKAGANLEKIESRMIKNEPFHYQFFIEISDFEWETEQIVAELNTVCEKVVCLGKYPLIE